MCPAVAYEMLVSHSPPVFSHSPPTSFLADYPSFRINSDPFHRSNRGSCRSTPPPLSFPPHKLQTKMLASPKRPCLVIRPDDNTTSSDEDPTSPTKLKKKVVFADDRGMSLTHVRFMTEPSNVPPLWSFRFLAEVTQGLTAEPEAQAEPWEITFAQPAADYVDFRKRLEISKVSLENVIVKEVEEILMGTIKVSNLSYHKEVVVRISADNWKSFEDAFCKFVPNAATSAAYVLYDTFSFKYPLRPRARKIEFCVCFRCDGQEYWDNNGGKNYVLVKKTRTLSSDEMYKKQNENFHKNTEVTKYADAVQAKMDSWSEFASWTHLDNSTPYW